jgi:hypothetical protein
VPSARAGLNCRLCVTRSGYASALSPEFATRSTHCRFRLAATAAPASTGPFGSPFSRDCGQLTFEVPSPWFALRLVPSRAARQPLPTRPHGSFERRVLMAELNATARAVLESRTLAVSAPRRRVLLEPAYAAAQVSVHRWGVPSLRVPLVEELTFLTRSVAVDPPPEPLAHSAERARSLLLRLQAGAGTTPVGLALCARSTARTTPTSHGAAATAQRMAPDGRIRRSGAQASISNVRRLFSDVRDRQLELVAEPVRMAVAVRDVASLRLRRPLASPCSVAALLGTGGGDHGGDRSAGSVMLDAAEYLAASLTMTAPERRRPRADGGVEKILSQLVRRRLSR